MRRFLFSLAWVAAALTAIALIVIVITATDGQWWWSAVAVVAAVLTIAGGLRGWLERRSGRLEVHLTVDGDTVELPESSREERDALIEEFIRRHVRQDQSTFRLDEHGAGEEEAAADSLRRWPPTGRPGERPGREERLTVGRGTRFNAWHAARQRVEQTVRDGLVAIAGPSRMRQGSTSTVTVTVSPDPNSSDDLRQGLGDHEHVAVLASAVSPVMRVTCSGDGVTITPMSVEDQLVLDNASWIFRVRADQAGTRTLSISVNLRLPEEGGWISRPALSYTIDVSIAPVFVLMRFFRENWQWALGIALGAAGTVTAWLKLVQS